jgi:hypothetical protein
MRLIKTMSDPIHHDVTYFMLEIWGDIVVAKGVLDSFDWVHNSQLQYDIAGFGHFNYTHTTGNITFRLFNVEVVPDWMRQEYESAQRARKQSLVAPPLMLKGPGDEN